jgi:drug/metabolite transporter (DMT)-like permease
MGAASVVGFIIAPMTGGFLHAPLTLNAALGVLYLAFFGSLLAYSAFVYLSKVWPPAKMGTYAFLNPLVAVLLGYFFLGEVFELRDFIGMAIILVGVAIVQLRLGKQSAKKKPL